MQITKTQENNTVTFALSGRLDSATSPEFEKILLLAFEEAGEEIRLDLAALSYISSAGLRVLLTAEKKAKKSGKPMRIFNLSEEVSEVFEMTGFSALLTIEEGKA